MAGFAVTPRNAAAIASRPKESAHHTTPGTNSSHGEGDPADAINNQPGRVAEIKKRYSKNRRYSRRQTAIVFRRAVLTLAALFQVYAGTGGSEKRRDEAARPRYRTAVRPPVNRLAPGLQEQPSAAAAADATTAIMVASAKICFALQVFTCEKIATRQKNGEERGKRYSRKAIAVPRLFAGCCGPRSTPGASPLYAPAWRSAAAVSRLPFSVSHERPQASAATARARRLQHGRR